MNNLVGNFTGMDGRINRQAWWIGVVVLIVVAIVLNFILGAILGGGMPSIEQLMDPAVMAAYAQKQGWISLIIGLITAYPYIALSVKRRHDRDNNGYDAIGLIVMTVLFLFFRYTPLGLAMRAAAQNPASSRLVGINVSHMLMLGWGLAGAIGSIGGMMVAPVVFLDPNMMSGILLYAFAAALIGGIDSPAGAVLGGFVVGLLENLIGTYVVGTDLKLSVALVLIVAVLIVRPSGILGKTIVTKV